MMGLTADPDGKSKELCYGTAVVIRGESEIEGMAIGVSTAVVLFLFVCVLFIAARAG